MVRQLECCLFYASVALLPLLGQQQSSAQPGAKLPQIDGLDHKGYTEEIPGTKVSFEMVAIPGGTYLMGSPENEKGRGDDEGPQHPVKVGAFWMGACEVTWDEYDLY